MEMFNGMFGKVANGMCRLTMNGELAVKTSGGYKTYNLETNRLTNCSNFVFNIGEEFFFVIPTNKVEPGDIILVGGKPKCVTAIEKDTIRVIDYEDSTVKEILPERHMFMGNTYFYGKIVSMFGSDLMKGKKGMNKMMSYMLMSQMLSGNGLSDGFSAGNANGLGSLLPLMMLSGGNFSDMFDGMFDFDLGGDDVKGVEDAKEAGK